MTRGTARGRRRRRRRGAVVGEVAAVPGSRTCRSWPSTRRRTSSSRRRRRATPWRCRRGGRSEPQNSGVADLRRARRRDDARLRRGPAPRVRRERFAGTLSVVNVTDRSTPVIVAGVCAPCGNRPGVSANRRRVDGVKSRDDFRAGRAARSRRRGRRVRRGAAARLRRVADERVPGGGRRARRGRDGRRGALHAADAADAVKVVAMVAGSLLFFLLALWLAAAMLGRGARGKGGQVDRRRAATMATSARAPRDEGRWRRRRRRRRGGGDPGSIRRWCRQGRGSVFGSADARDVSSCRSAAISSPSSSSSSAAGARRCR